MYRVTIENDGAQIVIHDARAGRTHMIPSGKIVREENSISSFSFTIYPQNAGFNALRPLKTSISVYNTNRKRYEFRGRVLNKTPKMDSSGVVSCDVICEDRLGYLNDSIQPFAEMHHYTGDDDRTGLEEFIDTVLSNHNERVEEYKRVYRGSVTVDPFKTSDDVTKQLNHQTTWTALKEKLVDSFGGYLVLREENEILYLDYLAEVGALRATSIELGRNMKGAAREIDPTNIITRLTPLGAKLDDESDERLTIAGVNDGLDYVESPDYIAEYGIIGGTHTWDDVTTASRLKTKALAYLAENNGIVQSNTITALDLSLLGLDADDFALSDSYPVRNSLIGLNDVLRIVKQTIDVVNPSQSSFTMGDTTKRLSDAVLNNQALQGLNGRSSYTHIRYSANANGRDMTEAPTDDTKYIGLCETSSSIAPTDYSDYTWSRYVGMDGADGAAGKDGAAGTSSYFHIKYSDVENPTAEQMTETPSAYIGTYVDSIEADSDDPASYTWYRFQGLQGADGEQGIPGTNGTDGKTSYLHIKYSDDGGSSFTANNGETPGDYIGQYVDFTQADSASVSDYTWSKIKGETGAQGAKGDTGEPGADGKDGADGAQGVSVSKVTPYYRKGTTATTAPSTPSIPDWSVNAPSLSYGEYLWCAYQIEYSSGATEWTNPFYLKSADDLLQSDTEPENPATGTLWLNTSETPYTLMRWNGSEWKVVSDYSESINTVISYIDTSVSDVKKSNAELSAYVQEKTVSKSVYDTFTETVRNILSMEADGTTMIFQKISEAISEVDGRQQTNYNEILKYIRFTDGNIILGEEGNEITLTIQNDRLSFKQNGVEIAYMSDNQLVIANAEIKAGGRLRLGAFGFVPRADGSLSFLKVGEGN